MAEDGNRVGWGDLLGKAAAISAIIGGWLYLTGWSFGYHYFAEFGIGVSTVQLDNRVLPLYGYLTVREFGWQLLLGAGAVVALFYALSRLSVPANAKLLLAAFGIPASFAVGYTLGDANASRVYDHLRGSDWPGFSNVVIRTTPDLLGDPLGTELAGGCYRLIYANASTLFLIRPVRNVATLRPPVLVLDRRYVQLIRIEAFQRSCA